MNWVNLQATERGYYLFRE